MSGPITDIALFTGMGTTFLTLLAIWVWRSRTHGAGASAGAVLKESDSLLPEPPERLLGERIFSSEDLAFVARQAAPPVADLFVRQRKALALSWLQQTRGQVGALMRFHRQAARHSVRLNPAMEFKIAANYALFLLAYETLFAMIWLRGPFQVRSMAIRISAISDRLFETSERLLAARRASTVVTDH